VALRFKLDENIPGEAIALLRDAGHDARSALERQLGGHPDELLAKACRDEDRILVTLDLDFGDIRAFPPLSQSGIWVLRPAAQNVDALLDLLRRALGLTASEPVSRRLWVIEHGQVRIRE